jgi:hypothetical protein
MKWGQIYDIEDSQKLLYWVLMFVLTPYFDDSIDHWLKDILKSDGGLSGDPGWEIEHFSDENGVDAYRVRADPNISGIEPSEVVYSEDVTRHAIRESLIALGEIFPDRRLEAMQVIQSYGLIM